MKRRASYFSFARALAAVLFAITAIVCSAAAQGTSGIAISVHGGAGEPVQGVTVRVEHGATVAAESVTGAEGRCSFPALSEGQYVVSVIKDGFERSSQVLLIQDPRRAI